MSKNIVLCGFMGSGKTVTGKALAKLLDRKFIDIDAFIEQEQNMSVSEIFKKLGEEHFRCLEATAATTLGKAQNIVISCGGGTVINPKNVAALKQNGEIFYLSASPEVIIKRLENATDRPLLAEDKENQIITLLKNRIPLYEAAADHIIDANKSITEVVEQISKSIKEA